VWATESPPACLRVPLATRTRAKRAGGLVSWTGLQAARGGWVWG
jgi:hypothetical protein